MSSKRQKSINAVLIEIAKPNRCVSKIGTSFSQQFAALKVKPFGDISVLNKHEGTKKKMLEKFQLKEKILEEEGRLKVIKSDLKRSTVDRNSVKDPLTMDIHLENYRKRVKREHNTLLVAPKKATAIKLGRILPQNQPLQAFSSPSRTQLQDYESKEDTLKPNAVAYNPKYEYVLKQEQRPVSLPALTENAGKMKKREVFEKQVMKLCNRLAEKIDRGHEISEMRENASSYQGSQSLLRAPSLLRRGSDNRVNGHLSSLERSPRKPSIDNIKKQQNNKTAQVT